MPENVSKMRQVVDWSAVVWAGLLAGVLFLLLYLFFVPYAIGSGNAWGMLRLLASIVLGPDILAPPATFHLGALIAAIATNLILSLVFAILLAIITHRWGLITGIVLGALFGLGLYCINFYTVTLLYPWFFAFRGSAMVWTHLIFGACAGGIYEALEVEEFVESVSDEA